MPQATTTPRWQGQRGRLEVWYATLTHPATSTGLWLHHEVVAPPEAEPFAHGWVALFLSDRTPTVERFGPCPASPGEAPQLLQGKAGTISWDLTASDDSPPLYTFPRWAWERELLPGAQVVTSPTAMFGGTVQHVDEAVDVDGSRGALAHIYGHGNAERLRPLPLVQLRLGGRDWPRDPVAAAPLLRARLGLPQWSVRGVVGRRRLRVDVRIPDAESVALDYADPDGSPATCVNSERSDADITLERFDGRWRTERTWSLRGTAHAEIGTRP